jgi:hypothetical protein
MPCHAAATRQLPSKWCLPTWRLLHVYLQGRVHCCCCVVLHVVILAVDYVNWEAAPRNVEHLRAQTHRHVMLLCWHQWTVCSQHTTTGTAVSSHSCRQCVLQQHPRNTEHYELCQTSTPPSTWYACNCLLTVKFIARTHRAVVEVC